MCVLVNRNTLLLEMRAQGHEPLSVGQISRNLELLPGGLHDVVTGLIRSAEFRCLDSLEAQIQFFKNYSKLTMEMIGTLLQKSPATLHRYLAATTLPGSPSPKDRDEKVKYGPNSALTIQQEEQVLNWILERQKNQNCPSPLEVREYAAQVKNGTQGATAGASEHLSRDWWHKFKLRHRETIGVKVAASREQARTRVTEQDVREYFARISSILSKIKTLSQIVNMDETGFHSRIDRDRRRKCVYNKHCETHVTFCQETASTTLSMMVAITAAAQVLRPMFVCRENINFRSTDLRSIKDFIAVSKSPKGYATESNMIEWIDQILVPYVNHVTKTLPDEDDKVYLIMGNCGIHNTANVRAKWQGMKRLEIVWLPPDTSHFLQMLDGAMFGALKSSFRNLRTPKTSPRIEGKIVRAYRAFWTAAFPTTVMSSFSVTGFTYTFVNDAPRGLVLNNDLVEQLVKTSCLATHSESDVQPGEVNDH